MPNKNSKIYKKKTQLHLQKLKGDTFSFANSNVLHVVIIIFLIVGIKNTNVKRVTKWNIYLKSAKKQKLPRIIYRIKQKSQNASEEEIIELFNLNNNQSVIKPLKAIIKINVKLL